MGVKIDKEDRQENYIKYRINECRAITSVLNDVGTYFDGNRVFEDIGEMRKIIKKFK